MTEDREAELLRQVPTLRCLEQIEGFRDQIAAQGETVTAGLMAALERQAARVRRAA
jgi:hypothetical protein